MIKPLDLYDEDDVDGEYIGHLYFARELYEENVDGIKEFLTTSFGNKMAQLESETYIKIEETIKAAFLDAMAIPNIVFYHQIGREDDEGVRDMAGFTPSLDALDWHPTEYWFHGGFTALQAERWKTHPDNPTGDKPEPTQPVEAAGTTPVRRETFEKYIVKAYQALAPNLLEGVEAAFKAQLEYGGPQAIQEVQEAVFYMLIKLMEDLFGLVQDDLYS